MVELMKKLQDTYPSYATFNESIGMSVEGRKIPSLKISDPSATGPKKAVFWNGGQHAREWVSPSTVFYLANQLLEKREDPKVSSWLQKLDFHFIPMQNPDGYQYSQVKVKNIYEVLKFDRLFINNTL